MDAGKLKIATFMERQRGSEMGRERFKAKKIKIIFFDIDDTLRNSKTGFIPASIPTVFKQLREKGILTGIASGRGILVLCQKFVDSSLTFCDPKWCLY